MVNYVKNATKTNDSDAVNIDIKRGNDLNCHRSAEEDSVVVGAGAMMNSIGPSPDKEGMSILSPQPSIEERGSWSNQVEFFLSCMAYAVGIGNVWRFPYKCYKNGGGVFLIPYLTMLALAALPLFYMELALGQFSQLGPNKVFGKLGPGFRGLGYGMLCVTLWVALYYNVIIAWAFYYTFASLTQALPWADCGNWYNTEDCFMSGECPTNTTFWNRTCTPVNLYCQTRGIGHALNSTHCNETVDFKDGRKTPAEEYFRRSMLLMEDDTTLDNMGSMNWKMVGCLVLSWVVVLACLIKGVKSAGKVVWFTALFPYLVLVILFIRGITLPGAAEGVLYFISPDWPKLLHVRVWADAATQIFYSLGPAFGGLITLASYNSRDNNCQRDAVLIAIINSGTSIFAGVVIFSILGFMAREQGVPVSEVVEGGTALAFVAYPTAVTKLPVSPLWSFLFFTMLLTLGLDSQFTMVETLITALYDEKPSLRRYSWLVVGGVCLALLLLGLPMCMQGGLYIFVLFDEYSGSWSLLILAVLEVVVVGWVYGTERFTMDIYHMGIQTSRLISHYWVFTWKVSTPLILSCVLVAILVDYSPIKEGEYEFPAWANGVGWGVAISSLVAVLPFSALELWRVVRSGFPFSSLVTPCNVHRDTATSMAMQSRGKLGSCH